LADNGSTYFLTGISGFVGSELCRELLERGRSVIGLVPAGEDLSRLAEVRDRVELITGDLSDKTGLDRAVRGAGADVVIHLAAESAPAKSFKEPLRFFRTNTLGTLNLLEAVRHHGRGKRFVFLSSAEVYGAVGTADLPLTEAAHLRPANPYAASKAASHHHLIQYAMHFGIETVEVRPFNMIGPGQDLGFVLPDFASQVAAIIRGGREPRVRVGRLSDRRDFVDVRDAVRAVADIAEMGGSGEVYHVCSGEAVEIKHLLDLLLEEAGAAIEVIQDPARLRPAKVPVLYGSHEKLTALCGWQRRIPLKETIKSTLAHWLSKV